MLTKADQELIEQTGMIPADRLGALEHALLCIGRSARDAAYAHPDGCSDAELEAKLRADREAEH